jgi:hypothetical protein
MIYVSNKFHISSCSGSLVTLFKTEVKENSCMVAYYFTFCNKKYLNKSYISFEELRGYFSK